MSVGTNGRITDGQRKGRTTMAKYFDSSDNIYRPIPKAQWYVLSNDNFMSGWGSAKGVNTCVVPCASLEEAEQVERYVRTRDEQKYVRIVKTVRAKQGVMYSLVLGWIERAKERKGAR